MRTSGVLHVLVGEDSRIQSNALIARSDYAIRADVQGALGHTNPARPTY